MPRLPLVVFHFLRLLLCAVLVIPPVSHWAAAVPGADWIGVDPDQPFVGSIVLLAALFSALFSLEGLEKTFVSQKLQILRRNDLHLVCQ